MTKKKTSILVGLIIAVLVAWYCWPRPAPQIDYAVRVGEQSALLDDGNSDTTKGYVQIKIPNIGPYEANGYGVPVGKFKTLEFQSKEVVPVGARIVISGTMEVSSGDSCPLSLRAYITKASTKNALYPNVSTVSENVRFSKPRIVERKGSYSLADMAPSKPGKYTIHLVDPFKPISQPLVYARATFKVTK